MLAAAPLTEGKIEVKEKRSFAGGPPLSEYGAAFCHPWTGPAD
jgi:hypothetical protein